MVRVKRAYEPSARADGYRVLVDRLWPRGLKKEDLELDAWLKELAPSHSLRRWFGHDPGRFAEFAARYKRALASPPARELLRALARRARAGTVTLVYSARDPEHNQAVVLKQVQARASPGKT